MKKHFTLIFLFISIISIFMNNSYAVDNSINLTKDEIRFVEENSIIRIGVDPDFVPFEFIDDDGAYKGIAADYLSLISKKTGLQFEVVKDLSWPEAYDMSLLGDIDMLPAIGKTSDREQYFIFSEPYYHFKRVMVTRDSNIYISGIEDLEGMTVAVQRNSSHHSYLLSYSKINLSLYDSVEAALTAVATGSEEAFVGNLASTNYLIRSNGLTNLRFISFEAEKEQALYIAARKDLPELISIIDKALNTITESEKATINRQWIDLEQEIDYGPFIRIASIIGSLVFVIMAVSFYWIVILRKEVEKRKLIQIDLERAKEDADEANNYKSSFLARMSHEIRTPLNAIIGMSYLLKKTSLNLTQIMYTDRITQASSTMLNLINDILDFSKIEAGKIELEVTSFSLEQVIQNVVNIISYKIEEHAIGFKVSKDPSVPIWFFGDPKRIEQVLLNILNNAVKFTNSGDVSLDIKVVSIEKQKYNLAFSIKDTGIGMTEEQMSNLFIPFTQGDISINRRFGGSGLGLSIVKNLVDIMGGSIHVSSKLGEGSIFIIYLSLSIDEETEEERTKGLSENGLYKHKAMNLEQTKDTSESNSNQAQCILVVEDNKTNQLIAKSLLQQEGIESIMASDGKTGVELFIQHREKIDLILMDLHMPIMNGYEASEKIRKISEDIPIVAMTADVIQGVRDKCKRSGIYHYISKPFEPDNFIQTIKGIIMEYKGNGIQDFDILNISVGLKNIGGDMEIYLLILNEYYNENKNVLYNLTQTIREGRYADAAQIIHKVKSSSGSIGAIELYNISIKYQKALDESKVDEILGIEGEFSYILTKLLDEILEVLSKKSNLNN